MNVYADLVSWGSELPLWQNELVRRVARQEALSVDDIADLADAALKEAEQQQLPYHPVTAADFPSTAVAGGTVQLVSIGRLKNVNALRSDQTLRFGSNLTVVYGRNASGKSGYARVLKKVFRARVIDDILPNLRDDASDVVSVASATLEFEPEGEGTQPFEWNDTENTDLPERFARFAVLDERCSRTYIAESELTIAPQGLDIPERVASEIDRVQQHLKSLAEQARPNKQMLQVWANESDAGAFVSGLSATTSQELIDRHTAFSEADREKLEELTAAIAALKRDSPQEQRRRLDLAKSSAQSLLQFVREIDQTSNDEALARLRDSQLTTLKAEEAAAFLRTIGDSETRADLLGTDPWRALLRSALDFVATATPGERSAAIEGRCSLCWQELDSDARRRLEGFVAYLTSDAENLVSSAKSALDTIQSSLLRVPLTPPDAVAELARNVSPEFATELDGYVGGAHSRARAMVSALATSDWDSIPSSGTTPEASLEARISSLEAEDVAVGDASDVARRVREMEAEHLELTTRQGLAPLRLSIAEFAQSLRNGQRYEAVAKSISTRDASRKAAELERKYRTAAFEKAVESELTTELAFARHTPRFSARTTKAKVQMRPIVSAELRELSVERVFSEGERTAISLASFLAEVSITGDTAGLIFDDPISSLDQDRRSFVARRLVKEASIRQVIVFTHDLSFFADLRRAAKDHGVDCVARTLLSDEWAVGTIDEDMPFGARSVADRVTVLKTMIDDMKAAGEAGNAGEARDICRHFYDRLRGTWERFIETEMLGRVIERLEKEVRPSLFKDMADTPEIRAAVTQNYTRCSDVIEAHDTPLSAGGQVSPTTAQSGQFVDVTYTVTNVGTGATDAATPAWSRRGHV